MRLLAIEIFSKLPIRLLQLWPSNLDELFNKGPDLIEPLKRELQLATLQAHFPSRLFQSSPGLAAGRFSAQKNTTATDSIDSDCGGIRP